MNEYLDYVVRLRDRVANTASQNGVTKWALGVGILYLIYQIIPTIASLIYQDKSYEPYLYIFFHMLGVVIALTYLYGNLKGETKLSIRDYRYKNLSGNNLFRELTASCFSDGLYFWIALYYVASFYLVGRANIFTMDVNLERWTSIISAVFGMLYILVPPIMLIAIAVTNKIKPEFPSPLTTQMSGGNHSLGFRVFITALFLSLFLANIFCIVSPNINIAADLYKDALIFATQASVALVAISYFIKNISTQEALSSLDKLERDIVIHNITENEIKLRLQEYFGYEINELILKKIESYRDLITSLNVLLDEYDNFRGELEKVPLDYKYEREKRSKEYFNKLKSLISLETKRFIQFIGYIDRLVRENSRR